MYNYDLTDLFNARNTVAIRLEEIIKKRGYTKSSLCKKAGISRPTLDKLLNGGPSSKLPYVKHITKLLGVFEITPNELMTGIEYPYSYARSIRCLLGEDLEEISCETEISIEELKDIEAGKDVPLQDLRDLAFYLGSSVNGIDMLPLDETVKKTNSLKIKGEHYYAAKAKTGNRKEGKDRQEISGRRGKHKHSGSRGRRGSGNASRLGHAV